MATRADMRSRIINELSRPDLTTETDLAISTAIATYHHERWYWTRTTNYTLTVTAGLDSYLFEPDIAEIIGVYWRNGQEARVLTPMTWDEYRARTLTTPANGVPTEYATSNEAIHLYPPPNATGSFLRIDFWRGNGLEPTSDDDDTNPWMNEAEQLIRWRAKAILYQDVIDEPEQALRFGNLAEMEKSRLRVKHSRRVGRPSAQVAAWNV